MKKLIFVISMLAPVMVYGQMSEGGLPLSYQSRMQKSAVQLPAFKLQALNIDSLVTLKEKGPNPCIYSVFQKVNIDLKKDGMETMAPGDSGTIWRYRIFSGQAKSIQLVFSKFVIPRGATLFLYNEDYSTIYGAFTDKNMTEDSTFTIADFMGNTVIVEYYEPLTPEFKGQLNIGLIGQGFVNLINTSSIDSDGYIGVNCPEGEAWQDQKHAVCMITFRIGFSGAACSGALLNSTANDGTPFFLTAHHCLSTALSAKTVIAYFNYEQKECNGSDLGNYKTISGSTLLSTGTESDYTLLKLANTPTADYKPYYAGWDVSGVQDVSSVGIHHPNELPKKISFFKGPAVSYDSLLEFVGDTVASPANTHWEVQYGVGKVYEGSSGSPLFDQNKRVIGQLHGGIVMSEHFYGKLSYSWTHHDAGYNSLKSYLDPNNTGVKILNGRYPSTNLPDAHINSDFTLACTNAGVPFSGLSAFAPQSWRWSFSPDNVTYLNGTDSSYKSPVVAFNAPGTYDVVLHVNNSAGTDSIVMPSRITAGNNLSLSIAPYKSNDSCLTNFTGLDLLAKGATTFEWSLLDSTPNYFHLDSVTTTTAQVAENSNSTLNTDFLLNIQAKGTHGTCVDSTEMTYPLFMASNDNISNAKELVNGTNGPFSNKCATIEMNEPIPPHTTCTGQLSWCDQSAGIPIISHSVWFYFTATSSEEGISSNGMDNAIAIYSANSYQDILNGNYALIAANDDRSASDPNPIIYKAAVTPGKVYWVQVDGSAGGSEGTFTLDLSNQGFSGIKDVTAAAGVKIYPTPAFDYVILQSDDFLQTNVVNLTVYNLQGELIYNDRNAPVSENRITIPTGSWDRGIYLVRLAVNGQVIYKKIVK